MLKDPEQETSSGKTGKIGAQSSEDLTGSKNSASKGAQEPHSDMVAKVPGKPDFALCIRTLTVSTLIAFASVLLLCVVGRTNWAWGFLIGALLSVFSFATLAMAVPFLMWPGAPSHMSALLQVTLIMKLPIYCVGLYLACNLPGVTPAASVFGICLVPGVITLRTLSGMVKAAIRAKQSAASLFGVEHGAESEAQTDDFSNDLSIPKSGAVPTTSSVIDVPATRAEPVKSRPQIHTAHTAITELAAE